VVRTFGAEGGYRTEVRSEKKGNLSQDDRRQVALLAAQVFQHVDEARRALDAEDTTQARKEVEKGREALKAVRALLPRTNVCTRTTAPDGKVIYEDEREVQDYRIPVFEGMIHARTLAPIQEAQRDASRVAGVQVVESEAISTAVTADIGYVEAQLGRAAKALDDRKTEDAARALLLAQVRGVDFQYSKEDTPLAEARDAIWLAKRALEENNTAQARANLVVARQQLEIYRQVLPESQRQEVSQLMSEVKLLEGKLHQEPGKPASPNERVHQGNSMARWWDQLNGWFKRRD
jgi:flagellin-specific chaperone FliS